MDWSSLAIYIGGMPVVLLAMGWVEGRDMRKADKAGKEYIETDPNNQAFLRTFLCLAWPLLLIASPFMLLIFGATKVGVAIVKFGEHLGRRT